MNSFFDNISELDGINGFEVNSFLTHAHNDEYNLTLVKYKNHYWAEQEESEDTLQEIDGHLYLLGNVWYFPFDYDKWKEDYNNGLNPNDFYPINYELI